MPSTIYRHETALGDIWSEWTMLSGQPALFRISLETLPATSTRLVGDLRSGGIAKDFDHRLKIYCERGAEDFRDVLVDPAGWTDFTTRVYQCCRNVRPGETLTYKQLAAKAGSPNASRAVGAAMSRNRILLVIPCHRVIASNGQLRGFSAPGGLQTKQSLLDLERAQRHFELVS